MWEPTAVLLRCLGCQLVRASRPFAVMLPAFSASPAPRLELTIDFSRCFGYVPRISAPHRHAHTTPHTTTHPQIAHITMSNGPR